MNELDNLCRLRIDGKNYEGWTRMEVQDGIEQVSGAFVLQ